MWAAGGQAAVGWAGVGAGESVGFRVGAGGTVEV